MLCVESDSLIILISLNVKHGLVSSSGLHYLIHVLCIYFICDIHILILNIRNCVECMSFGTGPFKKNCTAACTHLEITTVEKLARSECLVKDSEGCRMIFSMTQQDGFGKYFVKVLRDRGIKNQHCEHVYNV